MAYKILILGASYGSLFGTKCLMAGHNVTLVCRAATAELINDQGTEVRIRLRNETSHRSIRSTGQPGRLDASAPENVEPARYDLVVLAMQEPQYANHAIRTLMARIAHARLPCVSIMNMPPLSYLKRISGVDAEAVETAFIEPRLWDRFDPDLMTLCSPDPQAFRPPQEQANVLHVGLPTNFKVAKFASENHNRMLSILETDIQNVRLDGQDVPVKLRVHASLFVPLAKWSMLLTGNYRCITSGQPVSIRDAVHNDLDLSREIYTHVDAIVQELGAGPDELVPFEKYARAAEGLSNPSSAARALAAGAPMIERVDKLVQQISRSLGLKHPAVDRTVAAVEAKLAVNQRQAA